MLFQPQVSVIIPTFNRKSWLEKAVDSVLCQTFADFELIVVDDGSTDDTRTLFKTAETRVSYLYQENQGVASARNAGIHAAQGKWIAFLDSDDAWLPEKLEKQIDFHRKNPRFKISQTEEIWIRNGRRVNPMNKHKKLSGWIFEPSLPLCLISPSSVILAREVFERAGLFDESFTVCEDYEFWLRCAVRYEVGLLSEALAVKHGGHPDQLSRQYWGMDKFRILAMEKTLNSGLLTAAQREVCVRELALKCRIYAQGCQKRGRKNEALEFLEKPKRFV